jgi:hypothetical protein
MSDAATTVDESELAADAQFSNALQRVSFQPGILLGSEALNAEQGYHLRRLTRHQRWLVGPGTVFGLRVQTTLPLSTLSWSDDIVTATATFVHGYNIGDRVQLAVAGATPAGYDGTFACTMTTTTEFTYPLAANPGPATAAGAYTDPTDVRLTVSPGYAIDGLGREVVVNEPYSISLRDWLLAENASSEVAGNWDGRTLFLRVTVRSRAAPQALQPVVSELFDAGLDPVVTARIADSFLLEVSGDTRPLRNTDTPARPLDAWSPDHATPAAGDLPGPVTAREQATLAGITDPGRANALRLQAWLLDRSFPAFDDSPGSQALWEEASRLLLASVHVTLATLTTPPTTAGTAVNNLVRPFVRPNVLLAALSLP